MHSASYVNPYLLYPCNLVGGSCSSSPEDGDTAFNQYHHTYTIKKTSSPNGEREGINGIDGMSFFMLTNENSFLYYNEYDGEQYDSYAVKYLFLV